MPHYTDTSSIIMIKRADTGEVRYEYELKEFEGHENASFEITLYEICVRLTKSGEESFYKTGGLLSSLEKAVRLLEYLYKNLLIVLHL